MTSSTSLDFLRALKRADRAAQLIAYVSARAEGLTFTDDIGVRSEEAHDDHREAAHVARDGVGEIISTIPASSCTTVATAMRRLDAEGLSPIWVYLANELWIFGETIRARVSRMLEAEYALLADAWAWVIPRGERGWPPHRGNDRHVLDRTRPELVNTWVALADVGADQAAMHVVALDDDPSYPHDLVRVDAPLAATRALPVRAGTTLVWNANLLHWGGACALDAADARISCSFSLVRADATKDIDLDWPVVTTLTLEERLNLIARQIVVYGAGQPHITPELLEWARATCALDAFGASRRS